MTTDKFKWRENRLYLYEYVDEVELWMSDEEHRLTPGLELTQLEPVRSQHKPPVAHTSELADEKEWWFAVGRTGKELWLCLSLSSLPVFVI